MGNKSEYTNGLCHMTKMATMPIYGKNLKTSSSLESKSCLVLVNRLEGLSLPRNSTTIN